MSTTPEDPFARSSDGGGAPHSAPQPEAWGEPAPQAPQYGQPENGQPPYAQPQHAQPQYAQPGYQQGQYQQGYPLPYAGPNPRQAKNWMGIVALVASLSTIVTGIGCIAGIIFGHLSLSAVKKGEADNRSLGLAGLITGYVFLALGLLAIVAYIIFIGVIIAAESSAS
ncbi:DUF4190 domain-containing protein [Demequina aestuarii]|uniref:DUF4190 domain-containing protein n=1 Tax=Demequina aestuarii TaxID=327095 RepID=UPI00078173A1|nr:DUF4190 domain-containing protein [Demequina aestuarii]